MTTKYIVPSSSGGTYEIEKFDDEGYFCPCKGWTYRSKCRHVDAVKAGLVKPEPGPAPEPSETIEGDGDASFDVKEFE